MEIINSTNEIEFPLKGVIFDVDGTTFSTMDHAYSWQKHIYEKIGDKSKSFMPYNEKWIEKYNRVYAKEGLRGIYEKISFVSWDKNEKILWNLYDSFNNANPISPVTQNGKKITNIIKKVHYRGRPNAKKQTRLRIGINTTKSERSLAPLLEREKIEDCFDTIITYDDIMKCLLDGKIKQDYVSVENLSELRGLIPKDLTSHLEKPNALSTMLTLNSMGTGPRATIALEDTVNGIKSCKSNFNFPLGSSVYTIGVTWGFVKDKQKLIDAGADAIMSDINDIEKFIEMAGGFHGERKK